MNVYIDSSRPLETRDGMQVVASDRVASARLQVSCVVLIFIILEIKRY